jgi:outer membrane protein assembly factor BamB
MRRAAATWTGEWWRAGGGGSPWDPIVYDPELDLVFFGTGNGAPWYPELRGDGSGDNLYVSSIVAVRADSGEQVWHFQTTPGDSWDFDATQPLMLADLTIAGQRRRVIMQANKNGFFYVLDRQTGQLISAHAYAPVTWATGIDSTGRPIESSAARQLKDATVVSPSPEGAHNWHPMSFNPATGLVYFAVLDSPFMHVVDRMFALNPRDQIIGIDARYHGPVLGRWLAMKTQGWLVAWDPVGQREVWRVAHPDPKSGGTLSTAGNLVFQGRADGKLLAYRATDGHVLWEFDAGVGIAAPPITYAVGGRQFIAVLAGWGGPMVLFNTPAGKGRVGFGQLLAFSLGGTATLPRYTRPVGRVAAPTFRVAASRREIEEGGALYSTFCARCHGVDVMSGGSVPDLRFAQESTHGAFDEIVRDGARQDFGMPSFAGDLTPAQAQHIHAYVLDRTREWAKAGAAP